MAEPTALKMARDLNPNLMKFLCDQAQSTFAARHLRKSTVRNVNIP